MYSEFHILQPISHEEIKQLNKRRSEFYPTFVLFNKFIILAYINDYFLKEYNLEYLNKYHGKVIDNHFNKLPTRAEECGSFIKIGDKFFIQLVQSERYL
jgi:hypothetical protein